MTAAEVEALFTRAPRGDGAPGDYVFARWARPIAPVVFGVDDATLAVVKGAIEAVVTLAGHKMAQTDPEQGANLMIFFLRDWDELRRVPDLDRLVVGLDPLVARLQAGDAHQYRHFRFEPDGAIRACIAFVRMGAALSDTPADALALALAVQVILLWSDSAFARHSPLAQAGGHVVLRPDVAAVIRAAYDPAMPAAARDPSHALRLAARTGV